MNIWFVVGFVCGVICTMLLIDNIKSLMAKKQYGILAAFAAIPIIAWGIYSKVGTPAGVTVSPSPVATAASANPMMANNQPSGQMSMPENHTPAANTAMNMDLGSLAGKLAEKLKANPNNPDGWILLARTYNNIKNYKEAVPAFEKGFELSKSKDPTLIAEYAEALANANNSFDGKASEKLAEALRIDPKNPKALILQGTNYFNKKDYANAIKSFEIVLATPNLDPEKLKQAQGSLDEAKKLMGK